MGATLGTSRRYWRARRDFTADGAMGSTLQVSAGQIILASSQELSVLGVRERWVELYTPTAEEPAPETVEPSQKPICSMDDGRLYRIGQAGEVRKLGRVQAW